jgi:hypothetical protein
VKFVVYLTTYSGDKLPPFYIGSTNKTKALSGKYFGSIMSKKWKEIFRQELRENAQLFSLQILSEHETRSQAIEAENKLQHEFDAVDSPDFFNCAYAAEYGYFAFCNQKDQRERSSLRMTERNKLHNKEFNKERNVLHKNILAWRNSSKKECEFCKRIFDTSNFKRYHGENCKLNPNRAKVETYTCEICGFVTETKTVIVRWHNKNCKHK